MVRSARSPDLLQVLADVPEGMFAVDSASRIILWNQGAEELLGYTASDVLGRRCDQVMAGQSNMALVCSRNCAALQQARRGEVVPPHTMLTQSKGGQKRWVNVTHIVVPQRRRKIPILVHLFRDVTEDMEARRLVQRLATYMSFQSATSKADRDAPSGERPAPPCHLTHREREVLLLLAQGASSRTIAARLTISPTTVRNHIQNLLGRMGVHSRLEAVAEATRRGLLP